MKNRRNTPPTPVRRSIDGFSKPVKKSAPAPSPPPSEPLQRPQMPSEPVRILKPGHALPDTRSRQPATPTTPLAQKPVASPAPDPKPFTPTRTKAVSRSTETTSDTSAQKAQAPTKPSKPKNKFLSMLSTLAIVLLAVAVGFALFDAATGQWIVVAGGIVALILRIDSRMLFGAALFCLVMIPIMTIAGREALSENYALYTFILLAIGTVRAMIESTKNSK